MDQQNVEFEDVMQHQKLETKENKHKWDIVWPKVIALGIIHIFAIYGFFLKPYSSWKHTVFYRVVGLVSAIAVTGGAHRLWAHRTYKANTAMQILLAFCMSINYQNSIYHWCRDHRLHHRHSETEADPHNSKRGFFFAHMGWLMLRKNKEVIEKGKLIDMSDLEANPIVMFQHKYYYPIAFICFFMIPTFLPWWLWDEPLANTFFIGVAYRYVLLVHGTWCINSVAHFYGIKPYDKNIGPTDSFYMYFAGLGEGFHNYHHTFPFDYRTAELGGDWRNGTTMMIDIFAWLGWATDRKTASKEAIQNRVERTGDGTHSTIEVKVLDRLSTQAPRTIKDNLMCVLVYVGMFFIF